MDNLIDNSAKHAQTEQLCLKIYLYFSDLISHEKLFQKLIDFMV